MNFINKKKKVMYVKKGLSSRRLPKRSPTLVLTTPKVA